VHERYTGCTVEPAIGGLVTGEIQYPIPIFPASVEIWDVTVRICTGRGLSDSITVSRKVLSCRWRSEGRGEEGDGKNPNRYSDCRSVYQRVPDIRNTWDAVRDPVARIGEARRESRGWCPYGQLASDTS